MKHLILASGSPRRKELLELTLLPFRISVSNVEEHLDTNLPPSLLVENLSRDKALDISASYPNDVVLGADTIVVLNDHMLGKPSNSQEAKNYISLLSGKTHQVFTGVTIAAGEVYSFHEQTDVTFWELSESEIEQYVRSKEGYDKAGGYGIQGLGATLVKEIRGDYFNVVGLPLSRTVRELRRFGITTTSSVKKI